MCAAVRFAKMLETALWSKERVSALPIASVKSAISCANNGCGTGIFAAHYTLPREGKSVAPRTNKVPRAQARAVACFSFTAPVSPS